MSDTNVLEFRPRPEAPVQRLSGLRRASPAAIALAGEALALARADSAEAALRAKRATREARTAYGPKLQAVDAETRADWASRIRTALTILEGVALEVKRAEVLPSAVALREHAGLLEVEAARLDPAVDLPEGA